MASFHQLQEMAMLGRFNESQRQWVKDWINYEWVRMWAEYDWDFRDVGPAGMQVTAGDPTPTPPPDLLNVRQLYDQNGNQLEGLSAVDFDQRFPLAGAATGVPLPDAALRAVTPGLQLYAQSGPPCAFKVVNGRIWLGPTPDTSAVYVLVYVCRAGCHPNGDTTIYQLGPMTADADIPAYLLPDHHPLIAYRAARLGMKLTLDPSWRELDDLVREAEAAMLQDVLPDHGGDRPLQYGGI